jgi:uncharacterized sulfatase
MPCRVRPSLVLSVLLPACWIAATACGAPDPGQSPGPSATPLPPNIVLIISDDQGYMDYGFMGSPRVRTPSLDRLAREGVVFTHGYSSANVCRAALATLLTGVEPLQLELWQRQALRGKGRAAVEGPPEAPFAATLETLPRLLAERGYTSFQAGKHWEGSYRDAGFDEGMVKEQVRAAGERSLKQLVRSGWDPVDEFVTRNADRPFLVWFAPMLPHLPHDAPERFQRMYADVEGPAARYYASITWLDEAIGQLVERIRQLGLEDRTLFVFVADNGWDSSREPGANAQLGGPKGKLSIHDQGLRTPVILRWKGVIEPQPPRDELVSFGDVFATLVDYAGASQPPQRDGYSLRMLVEDRGTPWPRTDLCGWLRRARAEPGVSEQRTSAFFWRDARFRYVQRPTSPGRLFDLESDPRETRDVSDLHPDVVERANARIREWAKRMERERAASAVSPASAS